MAECFNIYIEDISCNGKGQIENLALLHILKGDTGDTGLSAYELALQIGFIGTLEEWIASLKGEKGEQGDKGEQGLQGIQGNQGEQGYTPYVGENGNWFINGIDTNIHAQGLKGDKGDKGDNSFSPYIDPNTLTWWVFNDETKQYEDTGISVNDFLKKDGSIPLNIGYVPTTPLGIATKDYVDKQLGSSIEQIALNSYINTANTLSYSPPITDITIPIVLPYNTPITKRLTFTVGEAGQWSKISNYTFLANITGAKTTSNARYSITLKYYLGATLLRESTRLNIAGEDFNYINQDLATLVQQTNLPYSATDSFYLDIIITATTTQAATTLNILSYVNAPATFNRIGGAVSTHDVFDVDSNKTQDTINNEKLDKANVALYNVTNEIPLLSGQYYTLTTAIAAIPANIRKLGLKITFQISATNTETWEFFNSILANITNVAYWRKPLNGTSNYMPKFTAPNSIENSQIYDDGTSIGIGTRTFTGRGEKLRIKASSGYVAEFTDGVNLINIFTGYGISGIGTAGPQIRIYTGDVTTQGLTVNNGNIGIGTITPTSPLDVNGDIIRLETAKTPATSGSAGNKGDICWDENYFYICIATNTWKRSPLTTW